MCDGPITDPSGKIIKPENGFDPIKSFRRFWEIITYYPSTYNDVIKSEENEIKENGKNNYDSSAQVSTSSMSF